MLVVAWHHPGWCERELGRGGRSSGSLNGMRLVLVFHMGQWAVATEEQANSFHRDRDRSGDDGRLATGCPTPVAVPPMRARAHVVGPGSNLGEIPQLISAPLALSHCRAVITTPARGCDLSAPRILVVRLFLQPTRRKAHRGGGLSPSLGAYVLLI